MFERLVCGNSTGPIAIAAFAVAASIFVTISWRAVRMKRPQVEHFANLPFTTSTPQACHESDQPKPTR